MSLAALAHESTLLLIFVFALAAIGVKLPPATLEKHMRLLAVLFLVVFIVNHLK